MVNFPVEGYHVAMLAKGKKNREVCFFGMEKNVNDC